MIQINCFTNYQQAEHMLCKSCVYFLCLIIKLTRYKIRRLSGHQINIYLYVDRHTLKDST